MRAKRGTWPLAAIPFLAAIPYVLMQHYVHAAFLAIGGLILLAVLGIAKGARTRATDPYELLDAEARSLNRVVESLATEVEEAAQLKSVGAGVAEACLPELRKIREEARRSLIARTRLSHTVMSLVKQARTLEDQTQKLALSGGDSVTVEQLGSSRATLEMDRDRLTDAIAEIDRQVHAAEAALIHMKIALREPVLSGELLSLDSETLRECSANLQNLAFSVEEANEFMQSQE